MINRKRHWERALRVDLVNKTPPPAQQNHIPQIISGVKDVLPQLGITLVSDIMLESSSDSKTDSNDISCPGAYATQIVQALIRGANMEISSEAIGQ